VAERPVALPPARPTREHRHAPHSSLIKGTRAIGYVFRTNCAHVRALRARLSISRDWRKKKRSARPRPTTTALGGGAFLSFPRRNQRSGGWDPIILPLPHRPPKARQLCKATADDSGRFFDAPACEPRSLHTGIMATLPRTARRIRSKMTKRQSQLASPLIGARGLRLVPSLRATQRTSGLGSRTAHGNGTAFSAVAPSERPVLLSIDPIIREWYPQARIVIQHSGRLSGSAFVGLIRIA